MNKLYETIVIFNISTDYKPSINKINSLCQEFTGDEYEIDIDEIGIKNLVYITKEQKRGYYHKILWQGSTDNLEKLEKELRAGDSVLKFMTMRISDEEMLETHKLKPKKPNIVDVLDIIYNL